MPFPDSPRVIYEKNPLVEVICQVRFPAILKIDSELPATYQEAIRDHYPIFSEGPFQQQIKLNLQPEVASLLGARGGPISFRGGRTNYEFISADQLWKVALSRETLTVMTANYKRWEEFKRHFVIALEPFLHCYSPAFFTRVGLRYRDVIVRSALGLANAEWKDILEPHIAGELSSTAVAHQITGCINQTTISLEAGEGQVLINHGLASNQEGETCYLIDSDFSTEKKTEINDVIKRLDSYNNYARNLFRWCITEGLHEAMGPEPIP